MTVGKAFVKQVLSGDTLILRGKPVNGPPPERILVLSNVAAPRLGTAKDASRQEPFALESSEFLRKLVVGKEVMFQVEATSPNGREFGSVRLSSPVHGETDVTTIMVSNGWLKVKIDTKNNTGEQMSKLAALESSAIASHKGIYSGQPEDKPVEFNLADPAKFFQIHQGLKLPAVVEQVRDGSTLRVRAWSPKLKLYQYLNLQISGIKAPIHRKDIPNVPDLVEPFAEEAKYFVETRLLQRDVEIVLEAVSGNMLSGSIIFPAGNIAEALLSEGLAKTLEWSLSQVTGGYQKYLAAESKAKERKVRMWKQYVVPAKGSTAEAEHTVVRIVTADSLMIEDTSTKAVRKVTLASYRAPKAKDAKEAYYHNEAKEFLRSTLIGRKVKVIRNFTRPAQDQYEERECVTIKFGTINIAQALIAKGLGTAMRHKKDDNDRATDYQSLLVAEDEATKQQLGVHSPKEPPVLRIIDASESAVKARSYIASFQRGGYIPAVVEYCANASRFKLYIPSQSCKITLVLGGLRVPKLGRTPQEKSEAFGPEGLDYVNRKVLQRNVEVTIEAMDKSGGFIGALFLLPPGVTSSGESTTVVGAKKKAVNISRDNLATLLLKEGLAFIHDYSAQQSPYSNELYTAEKEARSVKKGVWSVYDPSEFEEAPTQSSLYDANETIPQETASFIVSDISDGNVHIQLQSSELDQLEKLMADFSLHHKTHQPSVDTLKSGDYCSAQFTVDNVWYRARVKKVMPNAEYLIQYMDYGNVEVLPKSRLRSLGSQFTVGQLPPQALELQLAYVNLPSHDEDAEYEGLAALKLLIQNKSLQLQVLAKQGSTITGIVLDKSLSVNEELLRQGHALVKPEVKKALIQWRKTMKPAEILMRQQRKDKNLLADLMESYVDLEDAAKRSRVNIWKYGDFTADE